MKVVILAGGRGTRLAEETHSIPKPMVSIGGRPILWHIMRHYASYGHNDFVVALGYKGYVVKEYFANYTTHQNDLSINLGTGQVDVLSQHPEDWRVTLVDTGDATMTGGRLGRLTHLLEAPFMLTYGDGVSDVPIDDTAPPARAARRPGHGDRRAPPAPVRRPGHRRRHGDPVPREADRVPGPDQRRLLRLPARDALPAHRGRLRARGRSAGHPRRQGPARRLPARRLLDADGHPARPGRAQPALGRGQRTLGACVNALPSPEFWQGRRVLLTGHTGFKGAWLTCWLRELGAEVLGVSLPEPPTSPALWTQLGRTDVTEIRTDITQPGWSVGIAEFRPEVVLHLAAQSLVPVGHAQPALTFNANVGGTVAVLELLASLPELLATLIITTDKVYDPRQQPPHDETHFLGGLEPYFRQQGRCRAGGAVVAGDRRPAGHCQGGQRHRRVATGLPIGCCPISYAPGRRARCRTCAPRRASGPGSTCSNRCAATWSTSRRWPPGVTCRRRSTSGRPTASPYGSRSWPGSPPVGGSPRPRGRLGSCSPRRGAPAFHETVNLTLDSRLAAKTLGWTSALDWKDAVVLTLQWYRGLAAGTPGRRPGDGAAGVLHRDDQGAGVTSTETGQGGVALTTQGVTVCRGCGAQALHSVLDLGEQPLANELLPAADTPDAVFPLHLRICAVCGLGQLGEFVAPERIFGDLPLPVLGQLVLGRPTPAATPR